MAFFSLTAVIVSIIIVRSEWLDIGPAITTFVVALRHRFLRSCSRSGLCGDLDGWAARAPAVLRRHGDRNRLAGLSSYLAYRAYKLPWLYDITTDRSIRRATRPWPGCDRAKPIRSPMRASMPPSGQRAAIRTSNRSTRTRPPRSPFKVALAAHHQAEMDHHRSPPPQPTRREGHIEAVARSLIMGLRDDIVVRVRAATRIAHRYTLLLALRLLRFRQQRGAHPPLGRRHRRCHRQRKAGTRRAAVKKPPAVQPKSNEPSAISPPRPRSDNCGLELDAAATGKEGGTQYSVTSAYDLDRAAAFYEEMPSSDVRVPGAIQKVSALVKAISTLK